MIQSILQANIPPAFVYIAGALLVPLLRGKLKSAFMLFLPVFAFLSLVCGAAGTHWSFSFLGYDLVLARIDSLSLPFGYIFCIVSFIAILFALRVKDNVQHMAGLIYAGGALGVTFAGDLFTLYAYWEIMAVASTFLILARKTKKSQAAAFRYIMVHIAGGLSLLAGIVMWVSETGSPEFSFIGLKGTAAWLIFIGIAVNAALPPLHPWLKDAYPEATVTGAVFLSAFTTKSAVYVMARTFPGTDLLIVMGALMTAIPIFYAVIENDIRRVLAYSLINQVGFMLCGVGIGTPLAINGTVSHAFCHLLYKALLFMAAGSVLYMTGKIRCTDLGGLYKTMPLTCLFCIVGAASISAFPLFSGFVSKSMIIGAAAHEKYVLIWLVLQFASAGVLEHAGIKVPYFTFFGHDSGIRAKEPPWNMLAAMGLAAGGCVFLGVYPKPLYAILPYPVHYVPYTPTHVIGTLQLLMFGALAFYLIMQAGLYPPEIRAVNLDADWFYRKGSRLAYAVFDRSLNFINKVSDEFFTQRVTSTLAGLARHGPVFLAMIFAVPARLLDGEKEKKATSLKERVSAAIETGTLPIGIGALVAVLLLMLLFLLK
ncbi:Na(+)/H(+) antiporter subunit D [Acidobacteriota bacterium]